MDREPGGCLVSDPLVNRVYKHWLPVILWMGVISFMSTDVGSAEHTSRILEPVVHWIKPSATPEEFDLVHLLVRKAAHLSEYAVLGLLTFRALRLSQSPRSRRWPTWKVGLMALGIAACYAATDEYHQSFVAGRTPAVTDVFIDTCGAAIALSLICLKNIAMPVRDNKTSAAPVSTQV